MKTLLIIIFALFTFTNLNAGINDVDSTGRISRPFPIPDKPKPSNPFKEPGKPSNPSREPDKQKPCIPPKDDSPLYPPKEPPVKKKTSIPVGSQLLSYLAVSDKKNTTRFGTEQYSMVNLNTNVKDADSIETAIRFYPNDRRNPKIPSKPEKDYWNDHFFHPETPPGNWPWKEDPYYHYRNPEIPERPREDYWDDKIFLPEVPPGNRPWKEDPYYYRNSEIPERPGEDYWDDKYFRPEAPPKNKLWKYSPVREKIKCLENSNNAEKK